ncbi:hypothetical protein PGT21_000619 [Puccinia graminis f. sp. tritici]|uniref:Uncharacterized protein n=1 Tax=Puccinia graminis f. sp. tritici TaxID=56615 RepID=A0A5B0P7I5_PUCGR|nr:hypothetical protein PGT21_000619 [Puccinia graminis f. sp. tritici]
MISLTSATTQKLKPPTFSFSYHNSSNPTHHLPYSSVSLSHLNLLKISAKRTLLTAVTQQPPHLSSPIPTPTYPPSTDPESKPNPPLTCYPAVALYKPQPTKALASPSTHNRLSVLQLLLDSSFYPRLIKHPATHTSSVNHHCSTAAPPNQPQPIQAPFLWLRTRRRATTASALPLIHSSLYPRLIKHTATHTSSVNHHCSTAAPPNQPQPIQVPFLWLRTRCRATTASALPLIQLIQYSKSQLHCAPDSTQFQSLSASLGPLFSTEPADLAASSSIICRDPESTATHTSLLPWMRTHHRLTTASALLPACLHHPPPTDLENLPASFSSLFSTDPAESVPAGRRAITSSPTCLDCFLLIIFTYFLRLPRTPNQISADISPDPHQSNPSYHLVSGQRATTSLT